jgi:excisionase family DNA binding protein
MSLSTGGAQVPNDSPAVLKVREVAQELRCSKNTVYEMVRSGQLKALRLGDRNIRITREEVDRVKAAV